VDQRRTFTRVERGLDISPQRGDVFGRLLWSRRHTERRGVVERPLRRTGQRFGRSEQQRRDDCDCASHVASFSPGAAGSAFP
jgi:hypothetical protein